MILYTATKKQIHVLLAVWLMTLAVIVLYPAGTNALNALRNYSYVYAYSAPPGLVAEDTSLLPPANAVPILMYHGVIERGPTGPNTRRANFIAQMEILKKKGYQTISVADYDLFREGKRTLPARPIIITFDDGRKDSYYTVDRVLEELGFKATLFVATIKANENDLFYLAWDTLVHMRSTGRWEIEAHGRKSHDDILVDEKGTYGTYLTSREYVAGKGLESIEAYTHRVEEDYLNGITDLKTRLGIDARYFAVPMNDYGNHEVSNYEGAYAFNVGLTHRFFRLAFVQAQRSDRSVLESFYNDADSEPHTLKRLEVRDMSPEALLKALEQYRI